MERFSPSLSTTFCLLVPDASSCHAGLLSHTSTPWTKWRAHVDVVVLDENERCRRSGYCVPGLRTLLQHAFAGLVARVRFPGEHKSARAASDQLNNDAASISISARNQVGAFVGSKAARESNRQGVGAK